MPAAKTGRKAWGEAVEDLPLRTLFDEYIEAVGGQYTPLTLRERGYCLARFLKHTPGAENVSDVTTGVAGTFLAKRLTQVVRKTVAFEYQSLKAAWRWAVEQGYAAENPWARIPSPEHHTIAEEETQKGSPWEAQREVWMVHLKNREGKPWAIRWQTLAGETREQVVGGRAEAEKTRDTKRAELNGLDVTGDGRPLEDLADEYLASCRARRATRTIQEYRHTMTAFLKRTGATRAGQVTTYAAEQYVTRRLQEVRPATADKDVRALHTFWAWMIRMEQAKRNPWAQVNRPRIVTQDRPRLTAEEARALLARTRKKDDGLHAFVRLVLDTGCRLGELSHLRQEDVDWDARLVYVRCRDDWAPKGKYDRVAPVSEATVEALRRLRHGDAYLLAGRNHQKWERGIRKRLAAACEAAGVPAVSPHDLRRTAASLYVEAGVAPDALQAVFGWKSWTTAQRYYIRLRAETAAQEALAKRQQRFAALEAKTG